MEFIKNFFNDDKIIGLCSLNAQTQQKIYTFTPQNNTVELFYSTNLKNNFLLS